MKTNNKVTEPMGKSAGVDDFMTFFRYTLPGLVSLAIFLLALLVSDFHNLGMFWGFFKESGPLGLLISFIFGSGALGYIFANIYFALIWHRPFNRWLSKSTIEVYNHLRASGDLEIIGGETEFPPQFSAKDTRLAWNVLHIVYYCIIWKRIRRIDPFISKLVHVTHSLGASITGIIFGGIAWVVIRYFVFRSAWSFPLDLILNAGWVLIIFALGVSYISVLRANQTVCNLAFRHLTIMEIQDKSGESIQIHYARKK